MKKVPIYNVNVDLNNYSSFYAITEDIKDCQEHKLLSHDALQAHKGYVLGHKANTTRTYLLDLAGDQPVLVTASDTEAPEKFRAFTDSSDPDWVYIINGSDGNGFNTYSYQRGDKYLRPGNWDNLGFNTWPGQRLATHMKTNTLIDLRTGEYIDAAGNYVTGANPGRQLNEWIVDTADPYKKMLFDSNDGKYFATAVGKGPATYRGLFVKNQVYIAGDRENTIVLPFSPTPAHKVLVDFWFDAPIETCHITKISGEYKDLIEATVITNPDAGDQEEHCLLELSKPRKTVLTVEV